MLCEADVFVRAVPGNVQVGEGGEGLVGCFAWAVGAFGDPSGWVGGDGPEDVRGFRFEAGDRLGNRDRDAAGAGACIGRRDLGGAVGAAEAVAVGNEGGFGEVLEVVGGSFILGVNRGSRIAAVSVRPETLWAEIAGAAAWVVKLVSAEVTLPPPEGRFWTRRTW